MSGPRKAASALLLALGVLTAPAAAQEPVTVYTDTFRPFVLPEGEAEAPGARLVRMVLRDAGYAADPVYADFAFGLYRLRKDDPEQALSYPWRMTPARDRDLEFSDPILTLRTRLHYNVRHNPDGAEDWSQAVVGRTASYEYGAEIEKVFAAAREVRSYPGEPEALQALLTGEIDLLPLPSRVVDATLSSTFPNEARLIRSHEEPVDPFDLHLVAPDNAWGRDVIARFDVSLAALRRDGGLSSDGLTGSTALERRGDVAELVPAEGFPMVTGRTEGGDSFALPQGTRVLVLSWSEAIAAPTRANRVYQIMTDESEVLVLNGPHLGKELLVKNMHIAITE